MAQFGLRIQREMNQEMRIAVRDRPEIGADTQLTVAQLSLLPP